MLNSGWIYVIQMEEFDALDALVKIVLAQNFSPLELDYLLANPDRISEVISMMYSIAKNGTTRLPHTDVTQIALARKLLRACQDINWNRVHLEHLDRTTLAGIQAKLESAYANMNLED